MNNFLSVLLQKYPDNVQQGLLVYGIMFGINDK